MGTMKEQQAEFTKFVLDIDKILQRYGTNLKSSEEIALKLIGNYGYRMDARVPVPAEPGSAIRYENRQGSKIIAAFDKDGNWSVLCLASAGHIHQFQWTPEELHFDLGSSMWTPVRP